MLAASGPRPPNRLAVLGTPGLESPDGPVHLATRKALALIAFLAIRREPVARGELAALLWPDHGEEQARRSLRQELSRLTQALGASALDAGREHVRLTGDGMDVDVWTFWAARAEGRHQDAIDAYRGPLLQGLVVREAETFEDWLRGARESLQQEFLSALSAAAAGLEAQGRFQEAAAMVRRAMAVDPLAEDLHLDAMRIAHRAGDRAGALRIFQTLQQRFREELDVEPSPRALALAREIEAGVRAPSRLPTPATPIVGRHDESREVRALLERDDCRLLTIVGPGGVGKTRLALEIARDLESAAAFSDGVLWTELRGPHFFPSLGDALGLPMTASVDLEGAVRHRVKDQNALFVIDEAEKISDDAAAIETLLAAAPRVRVIATSRERLRLRGEWVYHLHGLSVPDLGAPVQATASAELFLKAAERARPGVRFTSDDWSAIGAIARIVGGLPLGLELAASWVRVLTCREIQKELEQSLDLLENALPHLPPRQRGLRAVVDSMLARLSPDELKILEALAVFRGGASLEAARAVTGATPARLADLADKALVDRDSAGRYQMLEIVRQRFDDAPAAALRRAHAEFFADLVHRYEDALVGAGQAIALGAMVAETENLRAALDWIIEQERADLALRMAHGLFLLHELRGWFREGVDLFSRIGKIDDERVRARADVRVARFQYRLGRYLDAETLLARGLARAKAIGDLDDIAFAINNQGLVALGLGRPVAARAHLSESLELRRKAGSGWGVANSVYNQGLVATALGEHAEAAAYYREAMDRFEAMNDARGMSLALTGIGSATMAVGQYDAAIQFFQSAVRAGEQLGDPFAMASALLGEGTVQWLQGHAAPARSLLERSLKMFRDVGDRAGMARALLALGQLAVDAADPATAARLQREGLALAREAAFPWGEALAATHLAQTEVATGDQDEARTHLIQAVGRALDVHVVPLILRTLLPAHALVEPAVGLALLHFIRDHPGGEHEVRETARRYAADTERAGVVPAWGAPPGDATEVARRVMRQLQG